MEYSEKIHILFIYLASKTQENTSILSPFFFARVLIFVFLYFSYYETPTSHLNLPHNCYSSLSTGCVFAII